MNTELATKVVYLSGPISMGGSLDQFVRDFNTARFAGYAQRLRRLGYGVINPCECPAEESWEDYMRHGLRAVADADLLAVLPDWEKSRGSRLEVFVARKLQIPVYDVDDLFPGGPD